MRAMLLLLVMVASKGLAADVRTELMATDSAFSARSKEVGRAQAFFEFAASDARMFREGAAPIEGPAAIRSELERQGAGVLTWTPQKAEVSASGDLGYTSGAYEFTVSSGHKAYTGTYLTVWRRQADSSWRWIADIGNEGEARDLE